MSAPRRHARDAVARRRRALGLLAVGVLGVGALVARTGGSSPVSESGRPASSTAPADRQAAPLPLTRAVGRKIMTAMDGTFPSRSLRARVRRGQVGGVILFGPNVSPRLGPAIDMADEESGAPPGTRSTPPAGTSSACPRCRRRSPPRR